jgi:SNF2 family DNA or RNA helicase
MRTCRALREVFGADLLVSHELAGWARAAIAAEAKLTVLRGQSAAELAYVPDFAPVIDKAMSNRTYQQVGAAFGAHAGNFLLADQPGLGKTIQALGAMVESFPEGGAHLVFCPLLAVTLVWAPEVAQWLPGNGEIFALAGDRAKREATLAAAIERAEAAPHGTHIFVVGNIEMARQREVDGRVVSEYPALHMNRWTSIIVDESHRALIRTSGKPTQTRRGMMALKARRKVALSGTPMRGKPEQLWGTLNWLRPDLYSSYWSWVGRYFRLTSNRYSNYILDGFKAGGEEALAADLHSIMLRRTKAEVLAELPPKTYPGTHLIAGDEASPYGIWLPMSKQQAAASKRLLKDGVVGADRIVNGHLAVATRQKQIAGSAIKLDATGEVVPCLPSPKFDWCVDKINELGIPEGEGRIVIASQFTKLLNLFAAEFGKLGVNAHLITGETPEKVRKAAVDDFQSEAPTKRVFLLNTKAGGVAITLDAADDLVILDETYVPDDQEQVEDRIHRTSRMHNVTIHYLRTLDSIEEEIAWVTAAREDVAHYLLDKSRGIQTARKLYIEAHRPLDEEEV